jgi:hypothetical protein
VNKHSTPIEILFVFPFPPNFLLIPKLQIFIMAANGNGNGVQQEAINTDIVTLTRFLTEEQSKHKEATGDFTYPFPYPL